MMYNDHLMSVDDARSENGTTRMNSSGFSVSCDAKPVLNSWAQEVIRAELGHTDEASSSFNSSTGSNSAQQEIAFSVKKNVERDPQLEREISFEFLDGVNEEKFDRLVKEEKVKTPLKRRHSQTPPTCENSRSNSPSSSLSSTNEEINGRQKYQFKSKKEEKRLRHNSYTSSTSSSSSYTEADATILARRQKQIDYGKNTTAYERYIGMVAKSERTRDHPRTPNKHGKYSRRAFDGLIKIWRKKLHCYDPPAPAYRGDPDSSSDSDSD